MIGDTSRSLVHWLLLAASQLPLPPYRTHRPTFAPRSGCTRPRPCSASRSAASRSWSCPCVCVAGSVHDTVLVYQGRDHAVHHGPHHAVDHQADAVHRASL